MSGTPLLGRNGTTGYAYGQLNVPLSRKITVIRSLLLISIQKKTPTCDDVTLSMSEVNEEYVSL